MQRSAGGLRHVARQFSPLGFRVPLRQRFLPQRPRFYTARPQQAPSRTRPGKQTEQHVAEPAPSPPAGGRPPAVFWTVAAAFSVFSGFYCVKLYTAATKPCLNPEIKELAAQRDVSWKYDDTADGYDSEVGISETLMGINRIRKNLARQCRGHVLEVSCGTGRNLGYYDIGKEGQVDSLTFVDLSPPMVDICKKKWDALFGGKTDRFKPGLAIRFLAGSALGEMPLAPTSPPRKYDTIIQTLGLCSTPSPVELLTNMVKYLDTGNPDARVLLLEHGRSYQNWLNHVLDSSAEQHAEKHGCWANRDIGTLVEDAAEQTGLEVVKERRHHLGTTWVFELRPKPGAAAAEKEPEKDENPSRGWLQWSR